jgi:CHAT domain-containing protein
MLFLSQDGIAQNWGQLESNYYSCLKIGNYLQAIQLGRAMYNNVDISERDTSVRLAYCSKLIGNAYSLADVEDSALFYYDNGLKLLELQKKDQSILASKLLYNKATILLGKENYEEYFSLLTLSAKIVRQLDYPEFPFSVWPAEKLYYYNLAIKDSTQYKILLKECISIYKKYNRTSDNGYKILTKNIVNDRILKEMGLSSESWFNLIEKYSDAGQYDSVIYYCQIIDIGYENNLMSRTFLIKANLKLGSAYLKKGTYDKSLKTFLNTLDYIEDNPRINNLIKYICYNNIGLCHYRVSDYLKSEEFYRIALKMIYDNWDDLSDYFPVAASNLSETLIESNNYPEAKELLTKALNFELHKQEISQKKLGKENLHPIYDALGDVCIKEGNYVEAENNYKRSIEIAKQLQNNKLTSTGLSSLANTYFREGNYTYSIDICKQAADLSIHAGDTVAYAFRLDDLCQSYTGINELSLADSFNSEARKLLKNRQNKEDYIISLFRGGMIKINQKHYSGALSLFEEADTINTTAYYGESSMSPYITAGLATCNYYLGNYRKAANLFKSILNTRVLDNDDILPNDDRQSILGLYSITLKKLRDYAYLDTIMYYYANSSLYKLSTILPVLPQKKKLELLYDQQYVYDIFFSNLMGNSQTAERLIKVGYNIAFKTKGYILNDEISIRKFIDNNDTTAQQLYSKLLRYKLYYFKNSGNSNSCTDSITKFENELSRKVKPFERCFEFRRMEYDNIVNSLKEDEISIEVYRFRYLDDSLFKRPNDTIAESHYVYSALIAKKEWKSPKFIYLFESNEMNLIWDNNDSTGINDLYSVKNVGTKTLYQLFWSPLDSFLTGISSIYIAPAGSLNNINLLAIPTTDKETIGEKYGIHIFGSTADLVNFKPSYITNTYVKSAIVYGGIDYDKCENNSTTTEESNNGVGNNISNLVSRSAIAKFGYLSGTLAEAKNITSMCEQHGIVAIIDTGKYGTETSFKKLSGKREPFILHIATHGYFFTNPKYNNQIDTDKHYQGLEKKNLLKWSDDPLLRSGLIFACANRTWANPNCLNDSTEDGILTSYEISNLDLSSCQLVVLSACETGLGDINGSEGVFGLQRAFKMAGVKNIIMSLWKVPDAQTSELMSSFYTYCFAGKSVHDALQAAQTDMRKKYPPYYWAGFKLLE